jgi:hypothetical protein
MTAATPTAMTTEAPMLARKVELIDLLKECVKHLETTHEFAPMLFHQTLGALHEHAGGQIALLQSHYKSVQQEDVEYQTWKRQQQIVTQASTAEPTEPLVPPKEEENQQPAPVVVGEEESERNKVKEQEEAAEAKPSTSSCEEPPNETTLNPDDVMDEHNENGDPTPPQPSLGDVEDEKGAVKVVPLVEEADGQAAAAAATSAKNVRSNTDQKGDDLAEQQTTNPSLEPGSDTIADNEEPPPGVTSSTAFDGGGIQDDGVDNEEDSEIYEDPSFQGSQSSSSEEDETMRQRMSAMTMMKKFYWQTYQD